jgi:hypothetical protein
LHLFSKTCNGGSQRLLLWRLKLWVRGVVEKNVSVRKIHVKAAAIQGISAVKSASSAAMDVAHANKEIMKFYVEG